MKIHPRAKRVVEARLAIDEKVAEAWKAWSLSPLEVVVILADLTFQYTKYPLRAERHPHDPDKKANEE